MKLRTGRWIFYPIFLIFVFVFIYSRSNLRKLIATQQIYTELEHPVWSERLMYDKAVHPNLGSGDHKVLYLVDVRRVKFPLSEAIDYYDREVDRLGFKECHVDSYSKAHDKFEWEWERMNLEVPSGEDILVISQRFPSNDGNIRRHEPIESETDL